MAKWTGKKSSVMFTKPEEPSFLKKFKERVGYKEDKGVMEKFETMPKATEEDLEDNDDELPQVVQLKPEDLSQEEFDSIVENENGGKQNKDGANESTTEDAKILFRKPTGKRGSEKDLKASTKKAKKNPLEEDEEQQQQPGEGKETNPKKEKKKEKSNKTLLSFDDEDVDSS